MTTWTPETATTASWTTENRIVEAGTPIGLLLVLTYPTTFVVQDLWTPETQPTQAWTAESVTVTPWTNESETSAVWTEE